MASRRMYSRSRKQTGGFATRQEVDVAFACISEGIFSETRCWVALDQLLFDGLTENRS
jgi:hypothetical protein